MEAADDSPHGAEDVNICEVGISSSPATQQVNNEQTKPRGLLWSLMRKVNQSMMLRSPAKETYVQETFRPTEGGSGSMVEEKMPLFLSQARRGQDEMTTTETEDANRRQCRICLRASPEASNRAQSAMVSPCRCDGTLRFVHLACLTRWIDVSSKGTHHTVRCELCDFEFRRKALINVGENYDSFFLTLLAPQSAIQPLRPHLPHVEMPDCVLNLLFLFLVTIMFLCAWVAVLYLGGTANGRRPLLRRGRLLPSRGLFLSEADVTVIVASILFLAALFLALFTQYRAEVSFPQLFRRFWSTNRNWRIRDYDRSGDEGEAGATIRECQKKRLLIV